MIRNHEPWIRLLSVSWPRPAEIRDDRWVGTPMWDAPVMPSLPSWRFDVLDGTNCGVLDWGDIFRSDVTRPGQPIRALMRGFYVVFRLRVQHSGRLVFFASDGCIVRRNGEIVHEDRERHAVQRHEIPVRIGDRLDVAQWQSRGRWMWGARWEPVPVTLDDLLADVEPYRHLVEEALTRPEGPCVKFFSSGLHPVRCALTVYSLVLNGYRPAGIQVFGDYQWDERSTRILRKLLPFADIVSLDRVQRAFDEINPGLTPLALRMWGAMKTCIGLFYPPYEYCYSDDDIFYLDRIDDALQVGQTHTLVYAPDIDDGFRYGPLRYPQQEHPEPPRLANVTTGFYLLKNRGDLKAQAERLVSTPVENYQSWFWEQGVFAWEFSRSPAFVLPSQQYFVPTWDGLPGTLRGYDWFNNPCGFKFVHFGGADTPKPDDEEAGVLFHDVLGRRRAAT
jgi:hypothetical protein